MPDNNQFKDEPVDPSRDPFKIGLPDTQGIGAAGDEKGIHRVDIDVPGTGKGSEPAHIDIPPALDPSRHPDPGSSSSFSPPQPVGPLGPPHVDVQPYLGPNFGAPFGMHWEGVHLVHEP